MSVGYPRKTLNITSSQDTSLYATEVEYHTAHLGPSRVCPQTCNVARALAGSSREPRARDRPVAQTSGPAFHAPALACGTHGKSRAGTARVAVNCTSTSLSPWHGFIPFPLVLLEQGLAVGLVSWHDSPRWCLELQQWHQTLAGGC